MSRGAGLPANGGDALKILHSGLQEAGVYLRDMKYFEFILPIEMLGTHPNSQDRKEYQRNFNCDYHSVYAGPTPCPQHAEVTPGTSPKQASCPSGVGG